MLPAQPIVRLHLLDTGYCTASESHMLRGAEHRQIACHALVGLIEHPTYGWLLWDTGYAPRMLEATFRWPYWPYRLATPLHIGEPVVAQLGRFGLLPSAIRQIIVSHFHADHIAGLRDFPRAQVFTTKAAYSSVVGSQGLAALRKAFIPTLLPNDFRPTLLPQFTGPVLPGLGSTYDLLGDSSLLLVELPGHARGQIGMVLRTQRGPVLLAADGAWHSRAIRERRPPARVTLLMVDDANAVQTTLDGLHAFAQAYPGTTIVPTHCPEVFGHLSSEF